MNAARDSPQLLRFQGHTYQLFADLAQSTIQKRRAMKPLLGALQQKGIAYKWGFLFVDLFHYQGERYAPKNPRDMEACLIELHLMDGPPLPQNEDRTARIKEVPKEE